MGLSHLRAAVASSTPPTQQEPDGADQVRNHAGGYSFAVDDWTRVRRFLILGTEGGTYYASERALTREGATAVERIARSGPDAGARLVGEIAQISESGRAPKNDPAILALAIAAKRGDDPTRAAALGALPRVCRTGTHLYHFASFVDAMGGWGRGTRRAVAQWFNQRSADDVAHQVLKYAQRDGWSARDLLRLSHAHPPTPAHDALYAWVCQQVARPEWTEPRAGDPDGAVASPAGADAASTSGEGLAPGRARRPARDLTSLVAAGLPAIVPAVEELRRATDPAVVASLIRAHRLPREVVPTPMLGCAQVWEALLPHMGLTALIRNLATMTRAGLIAPLSAHAASICARISDASQLLRARVHPIQVLSALRTYGQGHGERGGHAWTPVQSVVDALDAAFYASFQAVEPTGRATVIGLDVSGSMASGSIAGVPGLTPRAASAAMGLVTAAREPRHCLLGFSHRIVDVPITPRMRLDDAIAAIERIPMGATDCALPVRWATEAKIGAESFAVYTDNETWCGPVHPHRALQTHRSALGVPARLAVVGMTATGFTIADPSDAGMMDVVGFDMAAPALMSDFFRGA